MALGTSLPLSKDVPTVAATNLETYALRAADLGRSEYSVGGLTLPNSKVLIVSHEKGKAGEERHLVRFDITVVDALLVPATVSIYVVIVRPPNTAITNQVIIDHFNRLVYLLAASANLNLVAVLNNEV
jgi:hypothetical protein